MLIRTFFSCCSYALVLKSLSPEKVAKKRRCSSHAAIEPSLLPTAVGGGLPAVAEEAGVDFSGSYRLDLAASDNPMEMLAALGVSWPKRKAISMASRTVHIEHDHDAWTETTVAPGVTRITHLDLYYWSANRRFRPRIALSECRWLAVIADVF